MEKQKAEDIIVGLINEIKSTIREELNTVDDATKVKWQIVEAAKSVFNANYSFTNFPENSHEGTVGVFKPTLHQLDSFYHEIRNIGAITVVDTEQKDGETYIALRIKLLSAPT